MLRCGPVLRERTNAPDYIEQPMRHDKGGTLEYTMKFSAFHGDAQHLKSQYRYILRGK